MREKTTTDRDCSVELGARRRAPAATGVLRRLRRDERGLIAALTALIAVALVGTVGLAIDLGVWYRQTRGMQNAADAAALAAAQDATSASRNGKTSTYSTTGSAAAAHYGFVNGGANNVSVHVTSVTCPGDSDTCYKATISQTAPQFFSAIWHGPYTLSATAYADPTVGSMIHPYCLLALAHNGSPATGILRMAFRTPT